MDNPNQPSRLMGAWKNISKGFVIPQRIILSLMSFFGIVAAYASRYCLSIAINEIVDVTDSTTYNITDTCPGPSVENKIKLASYHWTNDQITWAMASFLYGYLITQIPGGILSERYGGKHVFGVSILVTAITTIITPIFIKYLEWKGLIITRVIMGLAQGLSLPALSCLIGQWVPKHERATLGSLSFGAVQIGSLIGTAITGWMIKITHVWESVFYVFGAVSLLWCVLWHVLCYSYPATHPYIKDKEYYYLQQELDFGKTKDGKKKDYPLAGIFTNLAVWSLALAEFGHDFSFFLLATYLPIYFKEVLHLAIARNGIYSGLPYVVRFITGLICGFLGDYLVTKTKCDVTVIRKVFTALNTVLPAVFLVMAVYNNCNSNYAVIMFCLGVGSMGFYYAGVSINAIDLSFYYSGIIMGFIQALGVVAGIISNEAGGYMTSDHTDAQWKSVFWMAFAVRIVVGIPFCIWGSGEKQEFDKDDYVFTGCPGCKRGLN